MYRPRTVCTSSGSALGSTYSPRAVHIPYTVETMRQLLHVPRLHLCMYIHSLNILYVFVAEGDALSVFSELHQCGISFASDQNCKPGLDSNS